MAHFAKLDENNIVIDVNVVNNNELLDENNQESEQKGIDFLTEWSGGHSNWKQTSYNGKFRANYAGIGFTYDPQNDVFYAPKPFNSWILNTSSWLWDAPIAIPNDGKVYSWDELTLNWIAHD